MRNHSQYFTNRSIAKLLISIIAKDNVSTILELGIGDGALSKMAIERWTDAHVYAVDIDEQICDTIKSDAITIIQADVLSNAKLYDNMHFDIALCNPPFQTLKQTDTYSNYLERANLVRSTNLKRICADIVFIARNLIMLKDNGILALILPDGILTRYDLQGFRTDLIDNYSIEHIIQLPQKSFRKTEAQTHIVIIKKSRSNNSNIPISIADKNGEIVETIYVDKIDACYRMDFIYHSSCKQQLILEDGITGMHISRGGYTYHSLCAMGIPFVHSKKFVHGENLIIDDYDNQIQSNKSIAHEGDILMVRVGSRCLGRVQYLKKGHIYISDCIYKISVPKKFQYRLFKCLCNEKTQERLHTIAHGVCAKVISKGDLVQLINQIFVNNFAYNENPHRSIR